MTDNQYYAQTWLKRMWNKAEEVKEYEQQAEDILGAKIPAYDAEKIPGGSDPNPTETKNIEYSILSEQIEKKTIELANENIKTWQVIVNVENTTLRGMLIARYINRKSWTEIGKLYNYSKSRAFDYRKIALDTVYPFIPKEPVDKTLD